MSAPIDELEPFVTSVHIERGGGAHEYVTVWIRGANVGTLCVGKGDGEKLEALLTGERSRELTPWMAGALDAMRAPDRGACNMCGRSPCECPSFAAAPGNWSFFGSEREVLDTVIDSLLPQTHPTAEAGLGAPAPSPPAASKAEVESRPLGVPPAAGAPPNWMPQLSPDDPRLRAVRRIRDGIDASFRADEREFLRRRGWHPPMALGGEPGDDAWREEETLA